MNINGTVAVITGAGSGIGRAMALALAERGGRIVAADVDDAGNAETLRLISAAGGAATTIHCDATNPADITAALTLATSHFERLDIVCNNAGIAVRTPFFEDEARDWARMVDINLMAVIEGTRQGVNALRETGGGVVINTASMGGLLPMPGSPVYAASKAGVVNFTRSLAYLAEECNVRVNAICPSYVDTPLVRSAGDEEVAEVSRQVGGIMQPEDVALGLVELVEDDTRAGAIMRVTIRGGRDYARDIRA